jgi:hypothetical protein
MVGEIMYDGYFKEIRAFRVYVLEANLSCGRIGAWRQSQHGIEHGTIPSISASQLNLSGCWKWWGLSCLL